MLLKSVAIFWTFLSKFSTKISNFQYSPAKNYIFTFFACCRRCLCLNKSSTSWLFFIHLFAQSKKFSELYQRHFHLPQKRKAVGMLMGSFQSLKSAAKYYYLLTSNGWCSGTSPWSKYLSLAHCKCHELYEWPQLLVYFYCSKNNKSFFLIYL